MPFEAVIGVEVHAELATRSKLFCGCAVSFGEEPNSRCCEICLGRPGTLPRLNRAAVDLIVKAGLAAGSEIVPRMTFDRKHYFYPDLPKGFQITQRFSPLCRGGEIAYRLPDGEARTLRLRGLHLEEDAGKLTHDGQAGNTRIDYNRCGIPLIELVSEPGLRSAEETVAFLKAWRAILIRLGVSACRMEEGGFRADVNISLRPSGTREEGTRTEFKNLSSFQTVQRAVEWELARQAGLLAAGKTVEQCTFRFDEQLRVGIPLRRKETAAEYFYFAEPDLPVVLLDSAYIETLRASLPELPEAQRLRYEREYGLPSQQAARLAESARSGRFFEEAAVCCGEAGQAAAWGLGDVAALLSERGLTLESAAPSGRRLGELIALTRQKKLARQDAKGLLWEAVFEDRDPLVLARERDLLLREETGLAQAVEKALCEHGASVQDYRRGKKNALNFLVGQVMRSAGRGTDPEAVRRLLTKRLEREEPEDDAGKA